MVFKVNPEAKADIQHQIHYYNDQQKGLGKRFHADVKQTFADIRKNPFYQKRYKNIRCMPLNKFPAMVHFTINEKSKTITVRAVFHTSLDPDKWSER